MESKKPTAEMEDKAPEAEKEDKNPETKTEEAEPEDKTPEVQPSAGDIMKAIAALSAKVTAMNDKLDRIDNRTGALVERAYRQDNPNYKVLKSSPWTMQ